MGAPKASEAQGPQLAVPFGPYRLLKRLAVGGMAELFLAKDTRTDRLMVLKRILPYLAEEEEFVRMFLDEARIAASLHHPNIAELYELGRLERSTFIAMEWIDGIDLRRMLSKEQERGGVVPPGIAAWLVARLCEGLHHAHQRAGADGVPLGIVHRDVSPQNVMVSFEGDVKLVDFGIAKATAWMSRSKPGVIKGKFLYLAPEQLTQDKLDHRADLFATGTLLYELATGRSPFYRTSSEAVIYAVRMEEADAPIEVRAGFSVLLSRIIMKCLMKDRARRFQSAEALGVALEDYMRAEAPTSRHEVVRYLNSLFGSPEERTSLHVPSNAVGPAAGVDAEPTLPLGDEPAVTLGGTVVSTVTNGPKDDATTAGLDSAVKRLGEALEPTAVSASATPPLLGGAAEPAPTRTDRSPPRRPAESEPEIISVLSAEQTVGLDAPTPYEQPTRAPPVRVERGAPFVQAPPPRAQAPEQGRERAKPELSAGRRERGTERLPPRKPLQIRRPVPLDPDDLVSTADFDPPRATPTRHPGRESSEPDGRQGQRVLLGIIGVSMLLLGLLLSLVLWPNPTVPVRPTTPKVGSPGAVVKPAMTRRVRVTLHGPSAQQIAVAGASLPGGAFEQAPGPVVVSWKCRRNGRLVDTIRTFNVPDVDAAQLELSCP